MLNFKTYLIQISVLIFLSSYGFDIQCFVFKTAGHG